ncbi:MAG: hypothetical protein RMJ88_05070 [Thermogemmata sp.]|nr:hypothetical protein [Thermogemmata sp.]
MGDGFWLGLIRADQGVTATEQVVGILLYMMGLEQALEQPRLLDQRTDIYWLGNNLV